MFLCGNDPEAKSVVSRVCADLGWNVIDAGGIESSRQIEELAMLWIPVGLLSGNWNMAFELLRR